MDAFSWLFLNMLKSLLPLALFVTLIACQNDSSQSHSPAEIDTNGYDSLLADSLGADKWGMKPYVMAFLKTGSTKGIDSTEAARLQRAHLDNITRLADEGKIVLAGPFYGKKGDLRGIFVFNSNDTSEVRELVNSDPAVQAGVFRIELVPWYSSASLRMINELHKSISREEI